jgi:hypothetical protein
MTDRLEIYKNILIAAQLSAILRPDLYNVGGTVAGLIAAHPDDHDLIIKAWGEVGE